MPYWRYDVDGLVSPKKAGLKRGLRSWPDLLRLDVRGCDDLKATPSRRSIEFRERWRDTTRDDFENIRFIASGSQGKVSLVKHRPSRRLFALKEMAGAPGNEEKVRKLGLDEANIMKAIKHPFIVRLQHVFYDQYTICLAMDYVAGCDLWSLIYEKKQAPMSEQQSALYLAQIALAIEYLHENGIIYCDLKGENVIIDQHGCIRLVDFGCARRLRANESCRMKGGTVHCLAPEALAVYFDDKHGYGFPADYWSLGVLAYEMMAGRVPFEFDPGKESLKQYAERITKASKELSLPEHVSEPAASFIRGLLNPLPSLRLGKKLCKHRFFDNIDFSSIMHKTGFYTKSER